MRVVHKSKNSKTVLEDDVDDISRYWKELGLEAFQASFSSDNWWIWVRLITINVIAWSTITLLLPRVFRARRDKTRSWCLERRRFRKYRRCGRWLRAEQSEMKPQLEWWWSGGFHLLPQFWEVAGSIPVIIFAKKGLLTPPTLWENFQHNYSSI